MACFVDQAKRISIYAFCLFVSKMTSMKLLNRCSRHYSEWSNIRILTLTVFGNSLLVACAIKTLNCYCWRGSPKFCTEYQLNTSSLGKARRTEGILTTSDKMTLLYIALHSCCLPKGSLFWSRAIHHCETTDMVIHCIHPIIVLDKLTSLSVVVFLQQST